MAWREARHAHSDQHVSNPQEIRGGATREKEMEINRLSQVGNASTGRNTEETLKNFSTKFVLYRSR